MRPRCALALLLLCGGCGLDRQPPFAGRRSAGVAPWQDLGPLVLCDGEVRLGSAPSAGLCAPTTALAACRDDSDCRSRESCTCAGCQVALCDRADECGAGRSCSFGQRRCDRGCVAAADCAAGESCDRGACRGGCQRDEQCQAGESCAGGLCEIVPCLPDDPCGCRLQRRRAVLREPSPLRERQRHLLWLEQVADTSAILRAISDDGQRFRVEPSAPVLSPDGSDDGRAGAPTLIAFDGGYLAVYANRAGALRRATSRDGIHFTVDAAPVIARGRGGSDGPSLVRAPGGGLLLYYAAADRSAIFVATSEDGVRFTPVPSPVLTPALIATGGWRDTDAIAAPFAEPLVIGEATTGVRLLFAGRGREAGDTIKFGAPVPEALNFSIGAAHSSDGRAFTAWPYGPIFGRVVNFVSRPSELDPAVYESSSGRRLFYRAASADEARSDDLGAAASPPEAP